MKVPADFPVRPLESSSARVFAQSLAQCGTCGRFWDDAIATGYTPAPGGRCPFEAFHAPAPKRATHAIALEREVNARLGAEPRADRREFLARLAGSLRKYQREFPAD